MYRFQVFVILLLCITSMNCNQQSSSGNLDLDFSEMKTKGALLTTRFKSFEELKKIVDLEYHSSFLKSSVIITYSNNGQKISSILNSGIKESDIYKTRDGNILDKVWLSLRSPYFVANRNDLMRAFILSRRRSNIFGAGDVAFYDLAETMMEHIHPMDLIALDSSDLSEKGFINTFNHINAQAFMTSIFSENLADFIADTHERNFSELITGDFTEEQLADIKNGPTDNYIDILNNEWGQELGKFLQKKYSIDRTTIWTSELLTNYLNDMQSYYSGILEIGLKPFRVEDEIVVKFSKKINNVFEGVGGMR